MRISIRLDGGDYNEKNLAIAVFEVPPMLVRDLSRPIDSPSSPGSAIFCTPPDEAKLILENREQFAEDIIPKLVDYLINALGTNDTVDGYPKKKECQHPFVGQEGCVECGLKPSQFRKSTL